MQTRRLCSWTIGKILTLPKRCNILMWNDSSIFWAVRLRDMRAHIHLAPINWDCVAIRLSHSTQNLNVWMVIWDFDWLSLIVSMDSNYCLCVNCLGVVVCHHSVLDVFALDRVWPKRNCYCLMKYRHRVSLCVIATMFRLSTDPICRALCLPKRKREKQMEWIKIKSIYEYNVNLYLNIFMLVSFDSHSFSRQNSNINEL